MKTLRLGRRAMACLFEVIAVGDDEPLLRSAAEEALAEIDRLDDQLSRFLPTSEVSRLNAAGRAERVEPGLYALLRRACEIRDMTGGAFDVAPGMKLSSGRVTLDRPIDLGAIGKGYALDRAAAILRARGVTTALLHGGSSTILAMGRWPVGIVDPRDGRRRGRVTLVDRALSASSGLGKIVDGRGHIVDPRTGREPDTIGAWSMAPNATDADALSTAFCVMDDVAGFIAAHPAYGAIVQSADEQIAHNMTIEDPPPTEEGITRRAFIAAAPLALVAAGWSPVAQDKPKEIRVALIGNGEQGQLLLSQLQLLPAVKVAAVCDTFKANREKAPAGVETYEDFKQLLDEEDVDAVAIATPTHTHTEIAVAALAAGRAVFIEAPMAHGVEAARAICKAASKKLVHVGHQRRTAKLYTAARPHVQSGATGKVLQIRSQWHRKMSWRRAEKSLNWRLDRKTSGGLMLEIGSHVVDLANWFLGATPVSVMGLGGLAHWKDGRDVDDHVEAVFEYPDGVQLSFGASLTSSYLDEFEVLLGTDAALLFSGQRKCLLFKEADCRLFGWESYAKSEMYGPAKGIVVDAEATKYKTHEKGEEIGPDAGKADVFSELEAFVTAVRAAGASPCDEKAGLKAAVAAAVAAEAIEKKTVIAFTKDHFEV